MTDLVRDRIALGLAGIALLLGLAAAVFGSYTSGIHWRVEEDRLVVDYVESQSQADRDGVRPDMIAIDLNGNQLIALPEYVYGEPNPETPDQAPPIIGTNPQVPTPVRNRSSLEVLLQEPIDWVNLMSPEALASGGPNRWQTEGFNYPGLWAFRQSQLAILPGLFVLVGGLWWLRSARVGAALRGVAIPLVVAVAVPLVVSPLEGTGTFYAVLTARVLMILGVIPLALGLTQLIKAPEDRRMVFVGVAGTAVGALITAIGYGVGDRREEIGSLFLVLTSGIALIPGVIAAGPIDLARLRATGSIGASGLLQSTELALAGATPFFAIASSGQSYPWPLIVWLLALIAAARFTVRPLARLATRATLQRDLVVAATEAERARLAADIHDDALQELTLLVRRLEASGDFEGADIGRTVADRLRAICGDLRLPILDDLGVGPALDWLVLRIERLAGGEVRLDRSELDARHSPDVELAIFRVAQEALANAVKHGKPPIVVRYRSTPGGISLAIDDAGPGITDAAPADAEQAGRFGLLNMAQRAEQIGAILDIKRWPTGGTHVALEWRPR
jgi:signal transduction histidine kinase